MEITTARLILREFTLDDWPEVLAYHSDLRYQRYYPDIDRTPEEAQAFVKMFLDQQAEQPRRKFQLAVTLKEEQTMIGNCGIRMDVHKTHQADIGYELSPDHWGKGYATEIAQAVVNFGFTILHLHRIWAQCVAHNQGSVRVLEKLGMKLEARLRDNEYFKDRWWDTLIFGVLDSEWKVSQQHRDLKIKLD